MACSTKQIRCPPPRGQPRAVRRRWSAWLVLLGMPCAFASTAEAPVLQTHSEDEQSGLLFASPTTRDHIGRVVVPVRINGRGPFRFIVDTGANHSTISPEVVNTLGLKTESESVLLQGITGSAQVAYVTVDSIEAGELTLGPTTMPVVWAPVMAGADGIFGAAGLTEKSLMIDFLRNRVAISHGVETVIRSAATRIHAVPATHGLITLNTRVGGVRMRAVLDTGSERTLGNLALRNALRKGAERGFVVKITSVYGATENVETGEIGLAPPIEIDNLHITDVAIVYGDFNIFKVWDLQREPAMIIGMDVLGTVASLSIDFKNQDVYVTSIQARNTLQISPGVLGNSDQKR